MPTVYVESQGTQLQIGDGASPEAFTLIPQLVSLGGPGGSATVIDISTLDSTGREKAMGLADSGQITCEMVYNPQNTVHAGLFSKWKARTQHNFRIVFTDSPSTQYDFAGYVLEFAHNFSVDEVTTVSMTIEVTGSITVS